MDTLIATASALLALTGIGVYCYYLQKRNPDKTLGELVAQEIVLKNETILMFLMFGASLGEALQAATVFAPNAGIHTAVMSRIITHLFISAIGMVGTLMFFREVGAVFVGGIDWFSRAVRILIVLVVFFAMVAAPLVNTALLAGNVKQEIVLSLFYYSLNPFVDEYQYQQYLTKWGYAPNWDAWSALEPVLKASIWINIFHALIAVLEGLRMMSSSSRRSLFFAEAKELSDEKDKKKSKEEKKEGKEGKEDNDLMESQKRHMDAASAGIKYLMTAWGYPNSDVNGIVQEALRVLTAVHNEEKDKHTYVAVTLAGKVASLKTKFETMYTIKDQEKKKEEKTKLLEEVKKLFESPLRAEKKAGETKGKLLERDKAGFGLELKKK